MRFIIVVAIACFIGAAVFATTSFEERRLLRADPNALPTDPALLHFAVSRGEPLFRAHCAACHGVSGAGNPTSGVPNLTDNDWLYGTGRIADIAQVIEYGIRSRNARAWNLAIMPAYARPRPNPSDPHIQPLSPQEISDVVEFLFDRQGRNADAAAAVRGAALFEGEAGCYDCHSTDAKGDSAIGAPDLTDAISLYGDGGRDALFQSIAYGRQGVCPAWIRRMSAAAIIETAVYVYSLSHARNANQ
ncbi:MAG TPA: c-type cytochrome [Steroidobacteraceae bacterium]